MLVSPGKTCLCMAGNKPIASNSPWDVQPNDQIGRFGKSIGPACEAALGNPRRFGSDGSDVAQSIVERTFRTSTTFVSNLIEFVAGTTNSSGKSARKRRLAAAGSANDEHSRTMTRYLPQ